MKVLSGVPQGSVLGPLLFLIFINDISSVVESPVKIKLFADDCLIYTPITNTNDQIKINQCLQALHNWCAQWGMEINYSKTTFTHITKKKSVLSYDYKIGNNLLTRTNSFKYLGVTITNDLGWHTHVEEVCSKAYKKLFYLRKKLQHTPKDVKLLAYKTFVRPILEYASSVWSPHQQTLRDKLEKIQRLAVRFICSRYRRTESVPNLIKSCNLEPLQIRREKQRLKLLFQIIKDQININKGVYIQPAPKRGARLNHSNPIRPFWARLDGFKHSFFPYSIEMWNRLPECSVTSSNVKAFECSLELYYRQHET